MIEYTENLIGRPLWENISPEAFFIIAVIIGLWVVLSIVIERIER